MKLSRLFLITQSMAVGLMAFGTSTQAQAPVGFCETSVADACFDFDTEPEGMTITTISGDSTEWRLSGGINDTGYLSVTDAENGQRGTIVVPDVGGGLSFVLAGRTGGANGVHHVDNLEVSTTDDSLSVSAWLRVGAGTDRPADGFSLSFVRADDPVLADGDTFAGWGAAENLPEEGTRTGISVGFDEWTSGDDQTQLDLAGNPVGQDLEGISLRAEGQIIFQVELPTRNGDVDDPTSLQTGPDDAGVDGLGWAQLTIDMTEANFANFQCLFGHSTITWKGSEVFSFSPIGGFPDESCIPEPAGDSMAILAMIGLGVFQRWRRRG